VLIRHSRQDSRTRAEEQRWLPARADPWTRAAQHRRRPARGPDLTGWPGATVARLAGDGAQVTSRTRLVL